jgi:hypothetical protein
MADLVTATMADSVRINSETYVTGTEVLLGDSSQTVEQAFLAAASSEAVAIAAITLSKLKAIYIISDEDLTLVFTMNSGVKTIALLADVPFRWSDAYATPYPCPFKVNDAAGAATGIVSCAASNSSGETATLTIRTLQTA